MCKKIFQRFAALIIVATTTEAAADECWIAGQLECQSGYSDERYQFAKDGIKGPLLICFNSESGNVSGNDLQLIKLGDSTLVGWAANDAGLETVNSYQVNRADRKLLYTVSRIGTATVTSALSDKVGSCVGDIVLAPE